MKPERLDDLSGFVLWGRGGVGLFFYLPYIPAVSDLLYVKFKKLGTSIIYTQMAVELDTPLNRRI